MGASDTTGRNNAYAANQTTTTVPNRGFQGPGDTTGRTTQQINNSWRGSPQRPSVVGTGEYISPQDAARRRQLGIAGGNMLANETGDRRGNSFDFASMFPASAPGGPGGPGGPRGLGGGGGGVPKIDMAAILRLLGGNKPTPYGPPKAYEYEDLVVPDYVGTGFREYDGSMYDTMRSGIAEGLAADARAGATAYGDARTELSQYQDPFTDRGYTQNQAMPAAMQRMLAANNVQLDPAEAARGGQADAAFGNVLALLGGNARQAQASNMRALAGDERRFGESLASEGRSMQFGVNMTESKAREQYSREKWQYGEDIARSNYEKNTQLAATNSAGRNAAGQSNTQATNEVNLANTRMGNESRDSNTNALINLLASGQSIDPAALAAFMGG